MSTLIHEAGTKPGQAVLQVGGCPSATVLVVDDSAFEHRVIARLLSVVEGLRVVFASGGEEGLAAVERESPDIILTDLIMPDMDGLTLVQRVRERFPAIPLILITAYGSEEVAMRALRAGAANYIPKKNLSSDLVDIVRQVLSIHDIDRRRQRLLRHLDSWEAAFKLGNDPDLVASLIEMIQEELDGLGLLDRSNRIRIGVALQEALTNALYHGNLEISSDLRQDDEQVYFNLAHARQSAEPYASRLIHVRVHIDREAVTFAIADEGPGFDTSRIDRPVEPEDLMRIGGRGLLLIRTFMDEVAFNIQGNQITMTKRLESPGLTASQA